MFNPLKPVLMSLASLLKFIGILRYTNSDIKEKENLTEVTGPYINKYKNRQKACTSLWMVLLIMFGMPLLIFPFGLLEVKLSPEFASTSQWYMKYLKVVYFFICRFLDITNNDITLDNDIVKTIFKIMSYFLTGRFGFFLAKYGLKD